MAHSVPLTLNSSAHTMWQVPTGFQSLIVIFFALNCINIYQSISNILLLKSYFKKINRTLRTLNKMHRDFHSNFWRYICFSGKLISRLQFSAILNWESELCAFNQTSAVNQTHKFHLIINGLHICMCANTPLSFFLFEMFVYIPHWLITSTSKLNDPVD